MFTGLRRGKKFYRAEIAAASKAGRIHAFNAFGFAARTYDLNCVSVQRSERILLARWLAGFTGRPRFNLLMRGVYSIALILVNDNHYLHLSRQIL